MKWIYCLIFIMPFYVIGQEDCDSSYPPSAASEGLTGVVQMTYDVNIQGQPVNITVIKSKPYGIFDEAAVCTLSKWRYQPQFEGTTAIGQFGLKVQLDLALEKHSSE